MTKRFKMTSELPKGWVDIIDTDNNQTLCNIRIEYANNMIRLLNKLYGENEQLKERIEFIFKQIKAFREDCRTYQDFDGASTITELIRILEREK